MMSQTWHRRFLLRHHTLTKTLVVRLFTFGLIACGVILQAMILLFDHSESQAKHSEASTLPTYLDAGTVVSVQLHDTTFSTSTTVNTTSGTFQVSGAVTASPGDVTKMRTEKPSDYQSLCVESSYKAKCYRML